MFTRLVSLSFFLVFSSVLIGQDTLHTTIISEDGLIAIRNVNTINTEAVDFAPTFYRNGLLYVSSKRKGGPVDAKIGETFFELFYADSDKNGFTLRPQPFSLELNSTVHEGPVSFDKDQNRIFFTRNNSIQGTSKSDRKGVVRMKIYTANRGHFDWENIEELPFNSDNFTCAHPSLSADGETLYFASDRPGGFGGMDIYKVEKKGSGWSHPLNLGPAINTKDNELFPFIHPSGYLFFTSDGHQGLGGLDLFMADLTTKMINHLPKPINSEADDLSLVLNKTAKVGYFASNREGGYGKDDIYIIEARKPIIETSAVMANVESTPTIDTTVLVTSPPPPPPVVFPTIIKTRISIVEENSDESISGAAIRIYKKLEDGTIENGGLYDVKLVPSAEENGDMVMLMERKKESDLEKPKLFSDRNGNAQTTLELDQDYIILVSKEDYTIREYTYHSPSKGENISIEIGLEPSTCLILTGVVSALPSKTPNANVEITIVNECDKTSETVYSNYKGEFEYCLPIGCQFSIAGNKTGYYTDSKKVSTVSIRGSRSLEMTLDMELIDKTNIAQPIEEGTIIVLENIYYDFNKSAIRTGAAQELDALANMMLAYESMEVQLMAHTDSRGQAAYNQQLSLERAQSAKEYLVRKGIAAKRVSTVGYGETQPRNNCTDGVECTEEEHQYNRRTEVKITKINEGVNVKYKDIGPEKIDRKN